jgi:hypothetical protein
MFKDYLFFSNNLQDAARQILEAQEAQAKKENVEEDESVEPGPSEPVGEPTFDDKNTGIFKFRDIQAKIAQQVMNKMLGKPLGPPNEKDGEFTRALRARDAAYDENREAKNWEFREDMIEKQRLARQRDAEEARRQMITLKQYYRLKDKENDRAAELEKQKEQEKERRRQQGGIPMSELA